MRVHEAGGESRRTTPRPRTAPGTTTLEAFRAQYGLTVAFTDDLRERRCRRTDHFRERLGETMEAFKPLFAPWNMEILFLLYMQGELRFNGVKRALGGVSSRVLTDKLRHLAEEGLVHREEREGAVHYRLTGRGDVVARHLHPLLFYLHNRDALREIEGERPHSTYRTASAGGTREAWRAGQ